MTEAWADQGFRHFEEAGLRFGQNENLDEVADGDGGDQQQNYGFDGAHSETLEGEQKKDVDSGDDDGPEERDMEEQVESDGAAEDLGQIAGSDGQFAHQPVGPAGPGGIPVAAALGEILAGDYSEARGDDLHEDGNEAGQADDPQERVFELSPALQVGAPVAGIHVADADEDCGADEGAPLLPESGLMVGDGDGAVDALERDVADGFDGCDFM